MCSGDLTSFGFKQEYAQARAYLDRLECERLLVIPGNHDSRNVGYVHFEQLFGERNPVVHLDGVVDRRHRLVRARPRPRPHRPEPLPLDPGAVLAEPARFRIFVLHHHLLPVPGTGRERNVVYDAGDALEALQRARVNLVLSGHKHVPYAWRLESLFVVNAGTVSSLRLRGNTRPCYNLIEIRGDLVDVWRMIPFHERERFIRFSAETLEFEKSTTGIEDEVTAAVTRVLALVDGEHYPEVVRAAFAELAYDVVGAVLLGGSEKLRSRPDYGVALYDEPRRRPRGVGGRARARPLGRAGGRHPRAVSASRRGRWRRGSPTRAPISGSSRFRSRRSSSRPSQ